MKSDESQEATGLLGVFKVALDATPAAFVEGKISVWDYSNPEHFNALWKCLEDETLKNGRQVLIIWSKTPIDESLLPVNTVNHVSPLHWAACAAKKCPQIQVRVLDLNPAAHQGQYLYEHYLSCEKIRLQWLRVFQAAHLFGSEHANGCFQPDAAAVATEALKDRLFPGLESKRTSIEAGHFIDRIRNELTSPQNADNRHAISNIIGPMILRSGRPPTTDTTGILFIKNGKRVEFVPAVQSETSHRKVLNSILRAASLMCAAFSDDTVVAEAPEESAGWLAVESECREAGLNPSELRITLVDDQWSQGWLAWIKEGLGAAPVQLQVSPDPDFLLKLLRKADCARQPFSLSLETPPNGNNGDKQDILLLDLRLFTSNQTAERAFLFALDEALTLLQAGEKSAGDKECIRQDLDVVKRRLDMLAKPAAELPSNDQARYVTVLPRLFARLDFSLPIIIFSSTGQLDVLRHIEDCPNLIASFSKPRHFQGADEEVVARAEGALAEAIRQAIRWLRGRKLVQKIRSRPLAALEKARKRCAGYTHFELYFDESGKSSFPNFRCAALLIGYRSGEQAASFDEDARHVHRQIEKAGINLWHEEQVSSEGQYSRDPRGQWEAFAPGLAEIFAERPLIPFVISRTPSSKDECSALDLAHPDAMDNALFDLLELILEIALIEVVPAICCKPDSLTLAIYGACRLQTLDLEAGDEDAALKEATSKWQLLKSRYGLQKDEIWLTDEQWLRQRTKYEKGKWCFLYRSLRADSFLPMLARCLGNRISSAHANALRSSIKTVIGVQLPKRSRPSKEVRHQHYVCDRMAFFSRIPHHNANSVDLGELTSWPPINESSSGFLGRRTVSLLRLVECGRQLDVGNAAMAFALAQSVLDCEGVFAEVVASRLQAVVHTLSPDSFDELCGLLTESPTLHKSPVVPADRFKSVRKSNSPSVSLRKRGMPTANKGWQRKWDDVKPERHTPMFSPASGLDELEKALDASENAPRRLSARLRLIVRKIRVDQTDASISDAIGLVLKSQFAIQPPIEVRRAKDDNIPYALIRFESELSAERILTALQGNILLFGISCKVDLTL